MSRKAPTPAPPTGPAPALKPHALDWSHKLILPVLAILVAVVFGVYGVYFNLAKLATDKEVDRLKAEVKQHEEEVQRAKDDAQWLRVEIAKDKEWEDREGDEIAKLPDRNDPSGRARIALMFGGLRLRVDALQKAEAAKFGEDVNDLWERAVKKAKDDVAKQ